MMLQLIPTVKVVSDKGPHGYVKINQSTYEENPGAYELFQASEGSLPQGGSTEGASEAPGANQDQKIVLPANLKDMVKKDLADFALEVLDLTLDPNEMRQADMVAAIEQEAKFRNENEA